MNKKGQFQIFLPFLIIGIIVVIVFAMVAIPIAEVADRTIDELSKNENFGTSNTSNQSMNQVKGLITPAFDQLIFIILMAIMIGVIVLAIFTDFHPVLLTVIIIAIILLVIITSLLVEVFDDISENEQFEDKNEEFTLTNVIVGPQLPIIVLITGVIVVFIIFSKRGRVINPV